MYLTLVFFITLLNLLCIDAAVSSRINFLFPRSSKWSETITKVVKERLETLDSRYRLIPEDLSLDFDYSGGRNNLQWLKKCINETMGKFNEAIVCAAIKDLHLLDHLQRQSYKPNSSLFITDEIIKMHFAVYKQEHSNVWNFCYIFKVFHSSVWSILLLVSLLVGAIIFLLEHLGFLITKGARYTKLTIIEAYHISYFTTWGSTVSGKMKTTAAILVLHMWQIFMVIILTLYAAGVITAVGRSVHEGGSPNIGYKRLNKDSPMLACNEELRTLCDTLTKQYNQRIIWRQSTNTSTTRGGSYIFVSTNLAKDQRERQNIMNLFYSKALVFVSGNITAIQGINARILRLSEENILRIQGNEEFSEYIGLPIRLRHIYGPIILLGVGCWAIIASWFVVIINTVIRKKGKAYILPPKGRRSSIAGPNAFERRRTRDETAEGRLSFNLGRQTEV